VSETSPEGDVYEWYQRGVQLLRDGNPAAAATLLSRAAAAEPNSRSILEALARAQYDAGRYQEAVISFTALIAVGPTDDYAHFGLGLAASRAGELRLAAEHLALAVAMRPDVGHYARALRGVRARQAAESA
jgi:tetratricopeptide (TPR) repeat protein